MPKFLITYAAGTTEVIQAKNFVGAAQKAERHGAVESIGNYHPKMVTRRNLMTGQEYQEPEDTPGYLSPASEAYWSA